ncbi:MAG: transposase [Pyrinomonadaceae bacterium]|nr:transposase [Pyrinomonadaceae bacterium]
MKSKLKTKPFWRSRGYLPHYDGGQVSQFVTTRLYDSLPKKVLERWRIKLERGEISDFEIRKRVEEYLDSGRGECYLADPRVANLVKENLRHHADKKYKLYAWVIMPNHLHYLITPISPYTLAEITHSNKSYTAHTANKILNRRGQFWIHESFDRYIRDEYHFLQTIAYIENNPVKAGLCKRKTDWKFSSAYEN